METNTTDIRELLAQKREEILTLARKHGAHNVRVFGSVARGDAGPDSDVDLLAEFDEGRSLWDMAGFKADMEGLLGRTIGVVEPETLHRRIRSRVLADALAI